MPWSSAYARYRARDGQHGRHRLGTHLKDVIIPKVERRELRLLVALDGLADCNSSLIANRVAIYGQLRYGGVDAEGVSQRLRTLCANSIVAQAQLQARATARQALSKRHAQEM